MSLYEIILRLSNAIQPISLPMLITAVLTLMAFIVINILAKESWVDKKSFKWIGVFYSLDIGKAIRLSASWVKLILLLIYIASFKKLVVVNYVAIIFCGLISTTTFRGFIRWISNVLGLAVEIAGLIAVNSVCGYIIDMFGGPLYVAIYVVTGILLAAYGVYIFLTELQDISEEREANVEDE